MGCIKKHLQSVHTVKSGHLISHPTCEFYVQLKIKAQIGTSNLLIAILITPKSFFCMFLQLTIIVESYFFLWAFHLFHYINFYICTTLSKLNNNLLLRLYNGFLCKQETNLSSFSVYLVPV